MLKKIKATDIASYRYRHKKFEVEELSCEIIDTKYDTIYNVNKGYSNVKMG